MATPDVQELAVLREAGGKKDSSLAVRAFEPEARERWDRFVLSQPGSSPHQLIAWKHVLEKTFGYESFYFYAEREGQLTGIAPLFLVSNWVMGRCLLSVPFGVYGGICAADPESEEALLDHIKGLAVSERVSYLELRNRTGKLQEGFHPNQLYVTFTSPISPDNDKNLKALPKDTRYVIRKAQKAGLEARHGTDQLQDFYDLFVHSMRKHGTPVLPYQLFENLISEYRSDVDLLMVYAGSKPISGTLSLFFRDSVLPYYAGAGPEATRYAANNFMYWKLMELAAQRGIRQFDFGRSKKGTGSYDFKTQWNMTIEPLNYQVYLVTRKTPPNFSPLNPKFQLATRVWQKMPLWMTRQIGPSVVRWFP
jgi:FemAB-related protein (PEP-CTERM system-associated)